MFTIGRVCKEDLEISHTTCSSYIFKALKMAISVGLKALLTKTIKKDFSEHQLGKSRVYC